jgi:Phage virion morphogenesis family
MAGGISIVIDDAALQQVLGKMLARAGALRPFYDRAGSHLADRSYDRFFDQRGPDGVPWLPPSPVTLALRKR